MTAMADPAFRPALVVVDMQEDFCPPVSTWYFTGKRLAWLESWSHAGIFLGG